MPNCDYILTVITVFVKEYFLNILLTSGWVLIQPGSGLSAGAAQASNAGPGANVDKGELRSRGFCIQRGWLGPRRGRWCSSRGAYRALPASLWSWQLGRNQPTLVVVWGLQKESPAASLLATGGGVVTVHCGYHHLPLIYQFSDGCVFGIGVYAWNCYVFLEQRDQFATI